MTPHDEAIQAYERCLDSARSALHYLSCRGHHPEAVGSEVWLRLRIKYVDESPSKSYLPHFPRIPAIARNRVVDLIRYDARHVRFDPAHHDRATRETFAAEDEDRRRFIAKLGRRLTESQRCVLDKYLEGASVAEAARSLIVNPTTIYVYLNQIRERCRDLAEEARDFL